MAAMTPTHPATPRRRQWYDKLADAILGDDDMIDASPSSRYALICEKCFAHNGLVKERMWEDARKWIIILYTNSGLENFIIRICVPEMWSLQSVFTI